MCIKFSYFLLQTYCICHSFHFICAVLVIAVEKLLKCKYMYKFFWHFSIWNTNKRLKCFTRKSNSHYGWIYILTLLLGREFRAFFGTGLQLLSVGRECSWEGYLNWKCVGDLQNFRCVMEITEIVWKPFGPQKIQ